MRSQTAAAAAVRTEESVEKENTLGEEIKDFIQPARGGGALPVRTLWTGMRVRARACIRVIMFGVRGKRHRHARAGDDDDGGQLRVQ